MYDLSWCYKLSKSQFLCDRSVCLTAYFYDHLIPVKISIIFHHDSALFKFLLFMLSLTCHFPNFGLEWNPKEYFNTCYSWINHLANTHLCSDWRSPNVCKPVSVFVSVVLCHTASEIIILLSLFTTLPDFSQFHLFTWVLTFLLSFSVLCQLW